MRPVAVIVSAGLVTGLAGCSPCGRVTVGPPGGTPVLDLCVDLAITAVERRTGLRGAEPPADDGGLLLEFPGEGTVCLDNESVAFDIDAVYANDAGELVQVRRLLADDPRPVCDVNVRRVLEVLAGRADAVSLDHVMTVPARLR